MIVEGGGKGEVLKKGKYLYLVHYMSNVLGDGRVFVHTTTPLDSKVDIVEIEQLLEEERLRNNVLVVNFQLLKVSTLYERIKTWLNGNL